MSIGSPPPFQYHKVQSFNQTLALACPKLLYFTKKILDQILD